MLSSRELKLSNIKTYSDVPYLGDNYSKEALLELKNAIILYETYYKDRDHDVLFSNGENMEFSIAQQNVSHMVGINHPHLIQSGVVEELYGENVHKGSYELLCDIVDNMDDILKLNQLKNNSLINFYRLKVRSEIFSKFSNFSDFNFGAIFYDKDKAQENGYSSVLRSNKFLFTDSDDPSFEYYMLGIADDSTTNKSYVETMFPCEFQEKMFKDQTIVMPTVISTTTPTGFDKIEATASQKLKLIKSYNEIEKKYGANFEYFHDYYATLSEQSRIDERQKVLGK